MITPLLPTIGRLQKAKLSFGLLGCILWDDKTDKVSCHICGKWYKFLGSHLKAHDISDDKYRMEFGLTFNYPLCGKGLSSLRKDMVTKEFLRSGMVMRQKLKATGYFKKNKKPRQIGTATESERNRLGLCDLQIQGRYNILKKVINRTPSTTDLREMDRALLEAITRRHGTLNNYREFLGEKRLTVSDRNRMRKK